MTACILVENTKFLEENLSPLSLQTESMYSSETLVTVYQTTRCKDIDDNLKNIQCLESIVSYHVYTLYCFMTNFNTESASGIALLSEDRLYFLVREFYDVNVRTCVMLTSYKHVNHVSLNPSCFRKKRCCLLFMVNY
jgi:hypothetical protein